MVLIHLLSALCSSLLFHILKIKTIKNKPCERTYFPLCLHLCCLHRDALQTCPWPPSLHLYLSSVWSRAPLALLPSREGEIPSWLARCSLAGSCTCWEVTHSPECNRRAKNRRKIAVLCSHCLIIGSTFTHRHKMLTSGKHISALYLPLLTLHSS